MQETSKSGQPILRHTRTDEDHTPATLLKPKHARGLEEFIAQHIGSFKTVYHEIVSDKIHLDVYIVEPTRERNYVTLVTGGMSTLPMSTPRQFRQLRFAELMITLPPDWRTDEESLKDNRYYWPVRLLKFLARFPHDYGTWVAKGHTIPNGDPPEPFSATCGFVCALLLPSILYGSKSWHCRLSLGREVNFYAIHPIYASEMQCKLDYGIERLLDLFDSHKVSEVVDTGRKPTC